ncbi:cytochrome P450 3A28-like [Agrilus planipennis]|uniref:Cytochrome P450 3A28-like n=1 Tax=Agrilus planipennis TaxID=224129 RepID=A0A7F5R5I7_AGRPL|nr:cytochrome P450 3A28-like [Agrilus planipennis]
MLELIAVLFVLFIIFFEYCKWSRTYWQNRNVICLEEQLTLKNFPKLIWKNFHLERQVDEIYTELKKNGLKHGGAYFLNEPVYVPVSLGFLEKVLVDKSTHLCPEYKELVKASGSVLDKISPSEVLEKVDLKKRFERSIGVKIGPKVATQLFLNELEGILDSKRGIGGFKKMAETLCRCLEEIAKNESARNKIVSFEKTQQGSGLEKGKEDFLNAIILETIRMYPVVPFLTKKCLNPLNIPGTDVTLEKGTKVLIPVSGIHRDSDNFVEPDYFNPQRFQRDNLALIQALTYWNMYSKKEMEFLRGSLKVLIQDGVLGVI